MFCFASTVIQKLHSAQAINNNLINHDARPKNNKNEIAIFYNRADLTMS